MKKRISALVCALLMLVCCTLPAFALSYMPLEILVDPLEPTTKAPTVLEHAKETASRVAQSLSLIARRYMILWILLVLIIVIIVVITISEVKQQKERDAKRPPKKEKKNRK